MLNKLPLYSPSKSKRMSAWFLVLTFLFTAVLTLPGEDSEAARRTVRKASAKRASVKRTIKRTKRTAKVASRRSSPRRNRNTPAGVFALYQNPLFGYGKCLPELQEPSANILNRNGIEPIGATEKERAALAKGVAQVERLLGNPIPREYQYDYQWIEASGAWNSGLSRIGFVTVKRPRGSLKGQLTGRMMHELGHRFGHANANENYNDYRAHMRGKKCMITTYCGKSLNEEFAEVFEAYVVNPDFLAKHCPDSYAYFKNKLFRNPENLLASCENPNSIVEHDGHDADDDDAIEDTNEEQIDENEEFDLPEEGPMPTMDPRDATVIEPPTPASADQTELAPEQEDWGAYEIQGQIPVPADRPQM